jgi:hypothetical protein
VLAAKGVLATGLPILPSDRVYTRGLVTIYATAPSIAAFGVHDWSARLPGIVLGVLLVPAVFLLAQAVAGSGPALVAGVFVVVATPLVGWSRQAWPPTTFLLLFTLTAYAGYRGFARDEPRWQVVAALGLLATTLAYEFAMLLPAGLGLYLGGRALRRDFGWWRGRATVAAAALGLLAVGLLAALGLALRAGSLAGADSELRHYFTPTLRLTGIAFYWRNGWSTALPLALLAPAGLLWRRQRGQPIPPGLAYLASLLTAALLAPTLVIQEKQEVQYGLAVLPIAAALAAWGLAALSPHRGSPTPQPLRGANIDFVDVPPHCGGEGEQAIRLPAPSQWGGAGGGASLPVILAAIFIAAILFPDAASALRPRTPSRAPTWLDDLRAQGFRPDDPNTVVFAEAPLVTQVYLGRADFYVQPDGFERYAYQDGPILRSLYTRAVLLKEAGDFERLVAGPYAGKTLWVIGQDDRLPRLTKQMDPALWQRLMDASGVSRPTRGYWIMHLDLPR